MKLTAQVVVDQPEDPDKIVIDSIPDTTSWIEEVFIFFLDQHNLAR